MRIVGGKHKGRRLAPVGEGDTAAHLRPTTDRTRESLFNILNNYLDFDDMRVVDFFAGTGALGLEAISRGAALCTFVDSGRKAAQIISANCDLLEVTEQTSILNVDVDQLPVNPNEGYDVMFCDPPYGKNLGSTTLQKAIGKGWIAPDAIIVIEDSAKPDVPAGFRTMKTKQYGNTVLTFLRAPE